MVDVNLNEEACMRLSVLNFPIRMLIETAVQNNDTAATFTLSDATACDNKWDFLSVLYRKRSIAIVQLATIARQCSGLEHVAQALEDAVIDTYCSKKQDDETQEQLDVKMGVIIAFDEYIRKFDLNTKRRMDQFLERLSGLSPNLHAKILPLISRDNIKEQHTATASSGEMFWLCNFPDINGTPNLLARESVENQIAKRVLDACFTYKAGNRRRTQGVLIAGECGVGKSACVANLFQTNKNFRQELQTNHGINCVYWLNVFKMKNDEFNKRIEAAEDEHKRRQRGDQMIVVIADVVSSKVTDWIQKFAGSVPVTIIIAQTLITDLAHWNFVVGQPITVEGLTQSECSMLFKESFGLNIRSENLLILNKLSCNLPLICGLTSATIRRAKDADDACQRFQSSINEQLESNKLTTSQDGLQERKFVNDQTIKYCVGQLLKDSDLNTKYEALASSFKGGTAFSVNQAASLWNCSAVEAEAAIVHFGSNGLLLKVSVNYCFRADGSPCLLIGNENDSNNCPLFAVHLYLHSVIKTEKNIRTPDTETPNSRDKVRQWLDSKQGDTCFHAAARNADPKQLLVLTLSNTDLLDACNEQGDTPLHVLAKLNPAEVDPTMHLPSIRLKGDDNGELSELVSAAVANNNDKIRMTCAANAISSSTAVILNNTCRSASYMLVNNENHTPLYYALATNKIEMALMIAIYRGDQQLPAHDLLTNTMSANLLRHHRDGAMVPNKQGNTLLHAAAASGCDYAMNFALNSCHCFDVNARNYNGDTPLHAAAASGRKGFGFDAYTHIHNDTSVLQPEKLYNNIYDMLKKAGGDTHLRNNRGVTPNQIRKGEVAASGNIEDAKPFKSANICEYDDFNKWERVCQQLCELLKKRQTTATMCDKIKAIFRGAAENRCDIDVDCSNALSEIFLNDVDKRPLYFLLVRLMKIHPDISTILMPSIEETDTRTEIVLSGMFDDLKVQDVKNVQTAKLICRIFQNAFSKSTWQKTMLSSGVMRSLTSLLREITSDEKKQAFVADEAFNEAVSAIMLNYAVIAQRQQLKVEEDCLDLIISICITYLKPSPDTGMIISDKVAERALLCLGTFCHSSMRRNMFEKLKSGTAWYESLLLGFSIITEPEHVTSLYSSLLSLLP